MEWNPQVTPRQVALVCHPHPLYGGTMHNKVVFRAAKAALLSGLPTLRFNFRGAGNSVGTFTGGDGERADVRAALDYLAAHFPGLPVCLMGFSFGSWVGLAVGATDARVSTLVGLGVPVGSLDFDFLRDVRKSKLLLREPVMNSAPPPRFRNSIARLPSPNRFTGCRVRTTSSPGSSTRFRRSCASSSCRSSATQSRNTPCHTPASTGD